MVSRFAPTAKTLQWSVTTHKMPNSKNTACPSFRSSPPRTIRMCCRYNCQFLGVWSKATEAQSLAQAQSSSSSRTYFDLVGLLQQGISIHNSFWYSSSRTQNGVFRSATTLTINKLLFARTGHLPASAAVLPCVLPYRTVFPSSYCITLCLSRWPSSRYTVRVQPNNVV